MTVIDPQVAVLSWLLRPALLKPGIPLFIPISGTLHAGSNISVCKFTFYLLFAQSAMQFREFQQRGTG
jgi:hypothetical protein